MADLSGDTDNQSTDHPSSPGMPRWVKVSGMVVLLLVLLLVVVFMFDIGGTHGAGRHQAAASATPVMVRLAAMI